MMTMMTAPTRVVPAWRRIAALLACALPFAEVDSGARKSMMRRWRLLFAIAACAFASTAGADWSVDVPRAGDIGQSDAFIDDDGSTLVAHYTATRADWTLIDGDGDVRWQRSYEAPTLIVGTPIASNRDRFCVAGTTYRPPGIPPIGQPPPPPEMASIACVSASSGDVIYSVARPNTRVSFAIALRAGGGLFVLESALVEERTKLIVLSANGVVESEATVNRRLGLSSSDDGSVVAYATTALDTNPTSGAVRYDFFNFDGVPRGTFVKPQGGFDVPVALDDYRFAFTYVDPLAGRVVAVLGADGTVERLHDFRAIGAPTAFNRLRADGDRLDAVLVFANVQVAIELRADGSLGAQRPLPRNVFVPPFNRDDQLIYRTNTASRTRVQVYDFLTGETLRDSYAVPDSPPIAERITSPGDLVTVRSQAAPAAGIVVTSRSGITSPPPSVPARQLGVRGAWAATYTSGQGVLVDVDLASGTVFAPWFTYARAADTNGISQTRWYTLQGAAAPNAASVAMTIFENTGGNFSAGPTTTARAIGVATLTFESCDRATLAYDFDGGGIAGGENGGVADFITLSRATPATDDCVQHDDTVVDIDVPAPGGGFDAKLSGTWLDPAIGGQGFSLIVRPGESIFGAWFTYDTPPFQEDATRQQWYTLQGALPANGDGSVVLPVFHTSGGFFDDAQPTAAANYGSVTLTVEACDRIRLDYRVRGFGANFATVYTGTQVLRRFGGCAQ